MAAVSKAANKLKFQTGDVPTESDFIDLIDSYADTGDLTTHIADVANPHSVTKTQVGLGNVDNTSDVNKPVSTAQQTALDLKVDKETFSTLTFGSTVNWNQVTKQTPIAKVTVTGDCTLALTNVKSGANGILKIISNTASAFTITFDSSFTNKTLNATFTTFAFPALIGTEYYLFFVVDGTTIEWDIRDSSAINLAIQDEGSLLTNRPTVINFVGSGVTATNVAGVVTVTISGGGSSPLTTKGDIFTFDTGNQRLAIGANGTIFIADSAAGTGNKWVAISGDATLTASGLLTIVNNAITNLKLATMPANTVKGNFTGITAVPSDYPSISIYDATYKAYKYALDGMDEIISGFIFRLTSPVTVTGITTSSIFGAGTATSRTITSSKLTVGKIVRVSFKSAVTTINTTDTITLLIKIAGTTIITAISAVTNPVLTNKVLEGSFDLVLKTIGSGGTANIIGTARGAVSLDFLSSIDFAINTTIANEIDVQITQSDASNTCKTITGTIELI